MLDLCWGLWKKINATESGEKIRKRKVKNRTGYTLIVSESDLHLDIRIRLYLIGKNICCTVKSKWTPPSVAIGMSIAYT